MKFQINKTYRVVIGINNNILTYTVKILDDDSDSVTFLDRNNKTLTYNKNVIISSEELQ